MKINKTIQGLTLNANSKKQKECYLIDGALEGYVEVECIKCLKPFKKYINEKVHYKIVKPPFSGFDEKYDIIEQNKLDIEEIIKSEIESIKSDFSNVCKECENKEFNKEF